MCAAEDSLFVAFTDLVMKLNETLFKPLLVRAVAWATDGVALDVGVAALDARIVGRQTVLCRLQDKLADTLKVRQP